MASKEKGGQIPERKGKREHSSQHESGYKKKRGTLRMEKGETERRELNLKLVQPKR